MADRVDKSWKTKGLSGFGTAAIFGTLQHYGVTVDEPGFLELARERYPLELASEWNVSWKGTGQFLQFPYAAADELVRRLFPERLTPMRLAEQLLDLVSKGLALLEGKPAELTAAFTEFDAKLATLPAAGARRDAFSGELVAFLERWAGPFNELPKKLAKAGHRDVALRFAGVHETVFPDRAGCVTALVDAVLGDRTAIEKLAKQAADPAADLYARHAALDALSQAEADDALKAPGLALFDAAAKAEEWEMADSVAHLMANIVRKTNGADKAWAEEVVVRFSTSHEHVGHEH